MPVIVQTLTHADMQHASIRQQIIKLYQHSPEFSNGEQAFEQLSQALQQDTHLYVAIFNEKITGAVCCQNHDTTRLLQYIIIHPANRGRGIAERLIQEVCRLEIAQGASTFQPSCDAIQHILNKIHQPSDKNP